MRRGVDGFGGSSAAREEAPDPPSSFPHPLTPFRCIQGVDLTRFLDYLERCVPRDRLRECDALQGGIEERIPFREGMPGASDAVEATTPST